MIETTHSEQLSLKTPKGNELLAHLVNGVIADIKAIDQHTGKVFMLGDHCAENLLHAMHAERMHENIGQEVQSIRSRIDRFPDLIKKMGAGSAALKPYLDELQIAEKTYNEMGHRAGHFKNTALRYADNAVALEENRGHGLPNQFTRNSSTRQV